MNRETLHLLAGLAHDLRTPLSAIAGHTSLLALGVHGELTKPQSDSVHRIQENQRQLLVMIGEFMTYAEAASGAVQLEREECELRLIVAQAVEGVTAAALARGVRVDCTELDTRDVSPPERELALVDEAATRRVLDVLLQDALTYSAADTVIGVKLERTPEALRVTVESDGEAVGEADAETLFAPYVRGSSGRAAGHALSLPYARALARAMDGELRAIAGGVRRVLQLDLPSAANLSSPTG